VNCELDGLLFAAIWTRLFTTLLCWNTGPATTTTASWKLSASGMPRPAMELVSRKDHGGLIKSTSTWLASSTMVILLFFLTLRYLC